MHTGNHGVISRIGMVAAGLSRSPPNPNMPVVFGLGRAGPVLLYTSETRATPQSGLIGIKNLLRSSPSRSEPESESDRLESGMLAVRVTHGADDCVCSTWKFRLSFGEQVAQGQLFRGAR
jgi:hypothetical protein